MIQHGFFILRAIYGDTDLTNYPSWFLEPKVQGRSIAMDWGKDMTRTVEALLTTFLQCDSSTLLATCPDILFANLGLASSLVVGLRLLIQKRLGIDLRGPGEKLLERTSLVLERVALDDGHCAARAGKVIQMMLNNWKEKRQEIERPTIPQYRSMGGDFPAYLFDDDQFWTNLFAMSGSEPAAPPM